MQQCQHCLRLCCQLVQQGVLQPGLQQELSILLMPAAGAAAASSSIWVAAVKEPVAVAAADRATHRVRQPEHSEQVTT
jgi:hypothetical protein